MLMLALAARKIPTEIVMDTLTVAKMWVAIKPDLYVSYIQPQQLQKLDQLVNKKPLVNL